MVGRALADCLAHGSAMWAGLVAYRRHWKIGVAHAQTQNGNGNALHSLLLEAGLYATNTFTQGGKGDMVCNVGVWIAKRLRLCAASFEECCKQSGDL